MIPIYMGLYWTLVLGVLAAWFCLESVAFHTALFFSSLSFSFAVLRSDSLVEGLSSSTHAITRLRLTFAASFLFHSSSAFLFCWFDP